MADIRCPMCGKVNDAELDVCQFCQARLKPVWAVHTPDEGSPGGKPSQKKNEDLPDWLRALRPDDDENQPQGGEEEELPDWLNSLRPDTPPEAEEPLAQPADETPDWLRGLREDSRNDDPGASIFDSAARGAQDFSDQPAGEEDLPSWLVHTRSDPDEPAGPISSHPPVGGDDSPFDNREDDPESGAEPAEEIPGWLSQGWGAEREMPSEEDQPSGPAEGIPDWLNQGWGAEGETPSEEDRPAGPAAETPDWLRSDWKSEAGEPPETSQPGEPEIPDWLNQNWGAEPGEPQGETGPGSETPDWLHSDWQAESGETGESSSQPEPEPERVEDLAGQNETEFRVPDWLNAPEEEEPEVQAPSGVEESTEPEAELLPEAEKTEEDTGQDWLPEPIHQDLSWLDELAQETEMAAGEVSTELPAAGSMIFDDDDTEDLRPLEQGLVPDWLRGMRADAAGLPDSLAADEAVEEPQEFAQPEAAAPIEPAAPAPSEEENLEHAELPTWLQAMRPVDTSKAAGLPRPEKEVEGAGPLAGIHGVLPSEPDISHVGKPAVPSYKLQVPEAQQAQADLFRQLIAEEGRVTPLQKRREISSQHLLRMLIALLLALAALAPLFYPGLESPLPSAPAGVQAAHQIVSGLPNGSPVLVSMDYEPGWSSELDPAASSLIRDLLARGVSLSLVSTTPTGPLQAERVMAAVNAANLQAGGPAGEYLNLGFLPGGAAGLSSFAQLPQLAVTGTLSGQDPWSQPQLQTIRSLSDFALVLVVTESPDDARAWIEQVQPVLGGTPLLMVVSAQAQPLVEPYFRGTPNQVQGLVTGLLGSQQYEQLAGAAAAAPVTWASYSLVLWAAIALFFLGGLISAGSAWLSVRKTSNGREG